MVAHFLDRTLVHHYGGHYCYKRRWKVERLFAWLKQFRRLSIRWEYKSDNFLGLLHLGCIVLLLRNLY